MRIPAVIAALVCTTALAHAGEVHTRTVGGTWGSDPQRGTYNGAIPNDAGYSFWLTTDQVSVATPVTVIAQIRFKNRVDYGGAGVALIDPNATNQMQKNLRIELSEREDTAGVGGWLGNENHFSGASKHAGKDIKVGDWYELALKVDGTRVIGFLDGQEIFNSEVPELAQLPQTLTVAPFVVEADVEVRVIVRRGQGTGATPAPGAAKPGAAKPGDATIASIASIEPYGHDDTDGSGVKWNAGLPRPSLDDDPRRGGKPNAEWDASYDLKGDRLCVRIASLRAPFPPVSTLAIGYKVTLDGAIFDNGTRTKTIVVMRFSGTPQKATAGLCETVVIGGTPREVAPAPVPNPVDPYRDPAPLPATGRISDQLPAKSKKQIEIEKLFAANVAKAATPDDYRRMYGKLDELILVVGKFHFLLEPVSRQWHFYNRLHDTWEPTGYFAGEATFSVVRGKVKVTKKRKGRA